MTPHELEDQFVQSSIVEYRQHSTPSSTWDFFRGLLFLLPVGWIWPEEKRVFDKVWASRHLFREPQEQS